MESVRQNTREEGIKLEGRFSHKSFTWGSLVQLQIEYSYCYEIGGKKKREIVQAGQCEGTLVNSPCQNIETLVKLPKHTEC